MAGYWPRYSFCVFLDIESVSVRPKKRNWIKVLGQYPAIFDRIWSITHTFFDYKIRLSSRETLTLFVSVILGTCLCLVSRGWEQRECSSFWLNEQPCTLYQRKRFSIASKVSSRHFICSAMLFLDEVILNQRNKLLQILCLRGQKTQTGFLLFRSFASFWPAKGQSIYCHQVTVCWGKIRIHWFVWRPFSFSARC